MKTYRAAVIGCSRMGAFIDNEVPDYQAIPLPYSHAAGFYAEERTDLVACSDLRPDVMEVFGGTTICMAPASLLPGGSRRG